MRAMFVFRVAIAIFACVLVSAESATTVDLSAWFLKATAFRDESPPKNISIPDFLLKASFTGSARPPCNLGHGAAPAVLSGTWQLAKYDRKHHIALAYSSTDAEGVALFEAPTPPVALADADLSHCGTGRGLRVGSPYSTVLSLYGPPVKHGSHFVVTYNARVPDVSISLPHRKQLDPERITLVIDHLRVSSILIFIECCSG